jgi:hypothetical protein
MSRRTRRLHYPIPASGPGLDSGARIVGGLLGAFGLADRLPLCSARRTFEALFVAYPLPQENGLTNPASVTCARCRRELALLGLLDRDPSRTFPLFPPTQPPS